MTQDWKQEYKLLCDYIAAHPEIAITPNEVSIPQAERDEFYRRFDDIRRAAVEEYYPTLPVDAGLLSDNYVRAEREIKELLGLSDILVPMDLFTFLHNPKEGLTRTLYNRTFDLLQGKATLETFENQAGNDLRFAAADLFRLGYEMWGALELIKLLDPDEAFLVDLDDDYKPFLRELKDIAFGRQTPHPTMRIPEFVLHSRKMGKYVAVKMMPTREIETYVVPFKPPVRPKKKTGDTSFALDSRAMILSFMETPDEIPIIADIYERTITSPDWIIEYITGNELTTPDSLDQVKRHFEALHPRSGTCLVLIDCDRESMPEKIPDNIHVVSFGFDRSRLQSVVDELSLKA